ncbi:MAG: MlaE family ABC transporter permease [Gammaproteobacteria bacterium]
MAEPAASPLPFALGRVVRRISATFEEYGYWLMLVAESLFWVFVGPFRGRPVRLAATAAQMMSIGIAAVPIVFMLSFAIGVMLAIQGIYTLRQFGAEMQVVLGIALSVVREFGALITGILVAGRSGSALAARLGTMQVNQEIDALCVMGIDPVRYLAAPVIIAMLVMMPALVVFADLSALLGGAVYCNLELGLSYVAYWDQVTTFLTADDVWQGVTKSMVFALIVALVGLSSGFGVTGGAEGVGRATTRSVVWSISYIILADMLFTYFLNR